VQGGRGLAVEEWADAIAHERRGQAKANDGACLFMLAAAMLFEPAQVVGQLADQDPAGGVRHVRSDRY
jgi:hypothetical protein